MLSVPFDEIVRPAISQAFRRWAPRLVRLLKAHVIHHRHQVKIDGRDGISGGSHGEGGLYDPGAVAVLFSQIEIVGMHIEGEPPKPRGQQRQETLCLRQLLRQRQDAKEPLRSAATKAEATLNCGDNSPAAWREAFNFSSTDLASGIRPMDQVGIGIEQVSREPGPHILTGKIGFRRPGRLLPAAR